MEWKQDLAKHIKNLLLHIWAKLNTVGPHRVQLFIVLMSLRLNIFYNTSPIEGGLAGEFVFRNKVSEMQHFNLNHSIQIIKPSTFQCPIEVQEFFFCFNMGMNSFHWSVDIWECRCSFWLSNLQTLNIHMNYKNIFFVNFTKLAEKNVETEQCHARRI